MKKLISMLLSVCLLATLIVPTFAVSSQENLPAELMQSESTTIGFAIDENYEYFSIIDYENQTAQAINKDLSTGEYIYGPKISFAQANSDQNPILYAPDHSITHQDTFLNYEYDINPDKTPVEWSLQRPKDVFSQYYFMVNENKPNVSYLEDYQDAVEALNDQEFTTIGYLGTATFATVKAVIASQAAISSYGILSGEAAVSIAESVMAANDARKAILTLIDCYNDCAITYKSVLDNTDNIHYED